MSQVAHKYVAYGAYELKASYQRNLFIGNLSVFLFFGALLLFFWINSIIHPILPKKDGGWVDTPPTHTLPPQTSFKVKRTSHKPSVTDLRNQIPTPVPDEEIPDEENIPIYSQTELAEYVDNGVPIDERDSGGGYFVFDSTYLKDPSPDSFIIVEKLPEMLTYKKPEFPRFCRKIGLEGTVIMQVLVTIGGTVKNARVAVSSGNKLFDEAALSVAYDNTFTPAIQNGIPIPLWVSYTVEFKLNK